MINENDLNIYLSVHEQVQEKLEEIIGLYGEIDNKFYDINEINVSEQGFLVAVEYQRHYQYYEHDSIEVDKKLLLSEDEFNNLKLEAEKIKEDRGKDKLLRNQKDLEDQLQKARDLLAKHGG